MITHQKSRQRSHGPAADGPGYITTVFSAFLNMLFETRQDMSSKCHSRMVHSDVSPTFGKQTSHAAKTVTDALGPSTLGR